MKHFVYCLTFSNNKVYIGMSRTDKNGSFTNRYRQHESAAKKGKSNFIYDGWRKHGSPIQTILSVHDTRDECALAEINAIQQHDSMNPQKGYNLSPGGEGLNAPKGSIIYEMMKAKVWQNPERSKKLSEALKGRPPSQATIDAANEWKSSEAGKEAFRKSWENPNRKENASKRTKKQMDDGGAEHLKIALKGRGDVRSAEGKQVQREKIKAFMNTEEGKKVAKRGYAAMASNPENLKKWKEGTDRWRATEANKENCRRMAKMSAQKCSKRVMLVSTGEIYNSQRDLAKAVSVSGASITHWVKNGKVARI
jgi:hypothetical protein